LYKEFFPPIRGRFGLLPPENTTREILNAIRYISKTGCAWRELPHDFPPWPTCFRYFSLWKRQGLFEKHREALALRTRAYEGRPNPEAPTACIIDSQSVKTTEMGGPRGNDPGKKIVGRKRHILADILGLVLFVIVTSASVPDREAGEILLRKAKAKFPTLALVHVDSAYNDTFEDAAKELGIKVEKRKKPEGKGFQVIKWRWVVERTHGWVGRYRRLSKDYERTVESSQAWHDIAMARLMTRRLTGQTFSFR
jgi:putative transposase